MKKQNKNVRKLTKVASHSFAVVIPPEIIRQLNWRERQKLVIKRVHGGVVIRDWRRPATRPAKPATGR